jgi:mycothiol synthase
MDIPTETDIQPLASKFNLRPAVMTDLESVAALTLAVCSADGDPSVALSVDDLRQYWQEPGFHLDTDTWVAETAEGTIVGYDELYNRHSFAALEGDGYVHPDFKGRGIGTAFLRRMEARARQVMSQSDPELRVFIRNTMHISDQRARELHENEGYVPIRFSWRMEIHLEELPATPTWPEGLELCPFVAEKHARPLFEAIDEAFRDHWGHVPMIYENWLSHTLQREDFDPSLCFVAWDGDQVAGMSICRYRSGMGWVNTLGVRRPWRKHGLGLALLVHSFGEFFCRGEKTVGLFVDAENQTGATRLYKCAGMHVANEFVSYLKELRPGREIAEEQ